MRALDLLTKNDLRALRSALLTGKELVMEREWLPGNYRLRITTKQADPIWGVHTIARVQTSRGSMESAQYIPTYGELYERLRGEVLPDEVHA